MFRLVTWVRCPLLLADGLRALEEFLGLWARTGAAARLVVEGREGLAAELLLAELPLEEELDGGGACRAFRLLLAGRAARLLDELRFPRAVLVLLRAEEACSTASSPLEGTSTELAQLVFPRSARAVVKGTSMLIASSI